MMNDLYSCKDIINIVSLNHLEYILNEKREFMLKLINDKVNYYHPFKKVTKNKERLIDQPVGKLKSIQTKIHRRILSKIPLHKNVFGSVKGKSIKDNAQIHLGQKIVVSLDLKDCFPRTKYTRVFGFFRQKMGYSTKISNIVTELLTYKGYVPQGAPTSSTLVNLLLSDLNVQLHSYCKKQLLKLSFWVDDIVFSGDSADMHITKIVNIIHQNGYSISNKKIKVMRRHQQQIVTGLGINKTISVPKQKRKLYAHSLIEDKKKKESQGQMAFVKFISSNQFKQLNKLRQTKKQ